MTEAEAEVDSAETLRWFIMNIADNNVIVVNIPNILIANTNGLVLELIVVVLPILVPRLCYLIT